MTNRSYPKILIISITVLFVGSIVLQNSTIVAKGTPSISMETGDVITYRFHSTGAFIPYADQILHLEVQDISDPNNILVDVYYGASDIVDAFLLNISKIQMHLRIRQRQFQIIRQHSLFLQKVNVLPLF